MSTSPLCSVFNTSPTYKCICVDVIVAIVNFFGATCRMLSFCRHIHRFVLCHSLQCHLLQVFACGSVLWFVCVFLKCKFQRTWPVRQGAWERYSTLPHCRHSTTANQITTNQVCQQAQASSRHTPIYLHTWYTLCFRYPSRPSSTRREYLTK